MSASGGRLRIAVVSSVGGHLREVLQLWEVLRAHDVFFILNDETSVNLPARSYRIAHAERDLLVLWNLVEAGRILRKERPDVILSTGAGPAVPVALVGRALGARVIFIETFGAVRTPSLSGRLMYRIADHFFYQWEPLRRFFPRGEHVGSIF